MLWLTLLRLIFIPLKARRISAKERLGKKRYTVHFRDDTAAYQNANLSLIRATFYITFFWLLDHIGEA